MDARPFAPTCASTRKSVGAGITYGIRFTLQVTAKPVSQRPHSHGGGTDTKIGTNTDGDTNNNSAQTPTFSVQIVDREPAGAESLMHPYTNTLHAHAHPYTATITCTPMHKPLGQCGQVYGRVGRGG